MLVCVCGGVWVCSLVLWAGGAPRGSGDGLLEAMFAKGKLWA